MDLQKIYNDNDFENAVVPEGQILVFNSIEDGKVVTRYKDSSGNFGTISGTGGSGGSTDVTLGQVNADGNFQPLAFDGTDALPDGEVIEIDTYYSWSDNAITVSAVPIISCTQYDYVEFDIAPFVFSQSGDLRFYSDNLPDGLSLDGSVISGSPNVYGSFSSTVTLSCYGAADTTVSLEFMIAEGTIPMPDPLFRASLDGESATAETGQQLNVVGTVEFVESEGRKCARMSETGNYIVVGETFTVPDRFTLALWGRPTTNDAVGYVTLSGGNYNQDSNDVNEIWLVQSANSNEIGTGGPTVLLSPFDGGNVWRHTAVTWDGNIFSLYVDGVLFSTAEQGSICNFGSGLYLYINSLQRAPTAVAGYGEYADVVLYDDALSAEQVMHLYQNS